VAVVNEVLIVRVDEFFRNLDETGWTWCKGRVWCRSGLEVAGPDTGWPGECSAAEVSAAGGAAITSYSFHAAPESSSLSTSVT